MISVGNVAAGAVPPPTRKQMQAVRIEGQTPHLDGKLDDAAWRQAVFYTDFQEREPVEFGEPQEKTSVAVLYDNHALYIGARMFSDKPNRLRKYLDRRDQQGLAEQLIVSLDTYHDRRTAYGFGVNTAGVRFDRYHPRDGFFPTDFSYNPVWTARTSIDDSSWTAEMRIPFSQLRFNKGERQVFGININRWIPSRNEDIFWMVVPRDATGWPSWFGNLVGIEGVRPSRRLELMPYAASDGSFTSEELSGDPFSDGSDLNSRAGGDLKMGLGPNLTLDATFNPDFGQVEADPAEVNLSAFETFFQEQRPFFTEGSQLFDAIGPRYFYSRRIGATPHGSASGDFVAGPENSTILGATKITGRLSSGMSVAGMLAVTDEEFARTMDTAYYDSASGTMIPSAQGKTKVEPMSFYGVARVQQEFGEDQSTAGIIFTAMGRDLSRDEPLAAVLTDRAYSGGADWRMRFDDGDLEVSGHAGFSHVRGSREVILERQLSSAHYFQRPDASHVTVDSSRTSLTGYTGSLRISREGGRHWLWEGAVSMESPELELNDAGILRAADDIDLFGNVRYRENTPSSFYRSYSIGIDFENGWNFGGVRQNSKIALSGNVQWANYWTTGLELGVDLRAQSDSRTRGGPLMQTEASWRIEGDFSNNYSAATRFNTYFGYERDELKGYDFWVGGRISTRVGTRIELSLRPNYWRADNKRQYLTTIDSAGPVETFAKGYVFSAIERSELSMQLRMNYYFTPDLSLEVYAEPFASSGRYHDRGLLARAQSNDLLFDSSLPTGEDFGVRSFRSNVVLRWEFLPGSTAFLVWQRNLEDDRNPGQPVRPSALFDSFGSPGADFLALKISYWIPVS